MNHARSASSDAPLNHSQATRKKVTKTFKPNIDGMHICYIGTKEIKKKMMPIQWGKEQKDIVFTLFNEGKSFEEISKAVNEFIENKLNTYEFVVYRTPLAVAYQCKQLGLISSKRLMGYEKRYKNKIRKDRNKNINKIKEKVFRRDGYKCIICGSQEKIEFCHIVPFRRVRKNNIREAVTLCYDDHRKFDSYSELIVKNIFLKMCSYYPGYSKKYELNYCHKHQHWSIILKI